MAGVAARTITYMFSYVSEKGLVFITVRFTSHYTIHIHTLHVYMYITLHIYTYIYIYILYGPIPHYSTHILHPPSPHFQVPPSVGARLDLPAGSHLIYAVDIACGTLMRARNMTSLLTHPYLCSHIVAPL